MMKWNQYFQLLIYSVLFVFKWCFIPSEPDVNKKLLIVKRSGIVSLNK